MPPSRPPTAPVAPRRERHRRPHFDSATLAVLLVLLAGLHPISAQTATATGDGRVNAPVPNVAPISGIALQRTGFEDIQAEVILGELTVFWRTPTRPEAEATLVFSQGRPGRWSSRPWQHVAMRRLPTGFEGRLPVFDLDLPVVYHLVLQTGARATAGALRIARPRQLGMETPSTVFWPYLEGFEEGAWNWRILAPPDTAGLFEIAREARTGKSALRVTVPAGRKSVTLGTTRVQAWQFERQGATGIQIWIRGGRAGGRVRLSWLTDAWTARQRSLPAGVEGDVQMTWGSLDLPIASNDPTAVTGLDALALEFIAEGPAEFFVDDLQLTGRWRTRSP